MPTGAITKHPIITETPTYMISPITPEIIAAQKIVGITVAIDSPKLAILFPLREFVS